MKRNCITGLYLLFLAGSLHGQGLIEMASGVDKSRITIGDLVTYTIEITRSPDVQVEMPGLGANLGGFEIRDYKVHEPRKDKGRLISSWDYVISTFMTGEFEIPPLTIRYTAGTDSVRILRTEPITIVVESMKPSEAGDIRDIKGPADMERQWWLIIRWIILGVVVSGLAATGIVWWKRRRSGRSLLPGPEKPSRPPHEMALEALDRLKRSDLLSRGEIKAYYSELSEILRRYIEGRYFIEAMELTSAEILEQLDPADISEADSRAVREILEVSDLAKFARWIPPEETHVQLLESAADLVRRTCIVLTPETGENAVSSGTGDGTEEAALPFTEEAETVTSAEGDQSRS